MSTSGGSYQSKAAVRLRFCTPSLWTILSAGATISAPTLKKEGYKQEDIAEILDGAPKSDFKPVKKKEKDDEDSGDGGGGNDDGGNPLAGL